ncbi:Female germline-specific tumor suppressor gld-1 [Toxocara canis]|uniref:Female germline-specific tumor suppressor gld-1 n=1 Tax=Toxocara canis TaxID=6265 RepID=A0A0B2UTN9_TOXCA|nr:Female germline-specific tumor suppressor gld-1 [Toxocara canis]
MDTSSGKAYSHFGEPLVELRKGTEAFHLSSDHLTPRKPLYLLRFERGSSSAPEGIPASEYTMEYLADLIKEKRQLEIFPQFFPHIDRLVNEEIIRVHAELFQYNFSVEKASLPEPEGEPITVQEKVYVPCKEHPDYNFVGRLLGPRGMTAKQLEYETGCKIMVRGRGSMRDRHSEELKRGKPNWQHLDDDLHVLLQCEDTPNRVYLKLKTGSPQLVTPITLVSPIRKPPSSLPPPPIFISPVGSPITPANIGSAPTTNSFVQSPSVDYSMLMNQLSFDTAALTSFSMGNGDFQPQSSAFPVATSLINAAPVPNPLQSYLLDSTAITPPASTGRDRQ